MTCKDCVHSDLCGTFTRPRMPDEANASERLCADFKNKADFVEVKHGYWKEYFSAGEFRYDCSLCNDGFKAKKRLKAVPNYCSNCGAKMDGGEQNGIYDIQTNYIREKC